MLDGLVSHHWTQLAAIGFGAAPPRDPGRTVHAQPLWPDLDEAPAFNPRKAGRHVVGDAHRRIAPLST